jgi:hypothetical protein
LCDNLLSVETLITREPLAIAGGIARYFPVDGPEPATVLGLRLLGRVPRADGWPEVIGGPAFLSRPAPSLRRPSRRRGSRLEEGSSGEEGQAERGGECLNPENLP